MYAKEEMSCTRCPCRAIAGDTVAGRSLDLGPAAAGRRFRQAFTRKASSRSGESTSLNAGSERFLFPQVPRTAQLLPRHEAAAISLRQSPLPVIPQHRKTARPAASAAVDPIRKPIF
jgi:hypothetical protein